MRGRVEAQGVMFHAFHIEDFGPAEHPLRSVKRRADAVLKDLSPDFNRAYTRPGAPRIPPERLLKALLLRALYSIRSETQLVEQIGYNFLFRWFLDLQPTDGVGVQETFSMNRQRFEAHGRVRKFFDRVVDEAIVAGLVSDGADDDDAGHPTVNFRGEKRRPLVGSTESALGGTSRTRSKPTCTAKLTPDDPQPRKSPCPHPLCSGLLGWGWGRVESGWLAVR
jgi:transposase